MDNHDDAIEFVKSFLSGNFLHDELVVPISNESHWDALEAAAQKAALNPDTNDFDALILMAAGMLREGERLPDWLSTFAADVLEEKRKRPTKRGLDKYSNWIRDYSLWRAVDEVAKKFDLPKYTNNELSDKITAAEIVGQAAGHKVDVVITAYKKFSHTPRVK